MSEVSSWYETVDLVAYDVRVRRKKSFSTDIVGVVFALNMSQALCTAKQLYPDYWFLTPTSQRRSYESERKH